MPRDVFLAACPTPGSWNTSVRPSVRPSVGPVGRSVPLRVCVCVCVTDCPFCSLCIDGPFRLVSARLFASETALPYSRVH